MLYHLMAQLESLVKDIIWDMEMYPYGRQAAAFKVAFGANK
jgi:hypothetical protein